MKTQNTRPMTNGEFVTWLVSQGVAEDVAAARINASDPTLPKRPLVDEVHDWTAAEIAAWKRSCMGLPPTATDAELAAAQAAKAAQEAAAAAIAGIYAPVEYQGKLYPADLSSLDKYEIGKQSRNRGRLNRGIAVATDGSILLMSTPAEIDAFHGAIEDALAARTHATHDAIKASRGNP